VTDAARPREPHWRQPYMKAAAGETLRPGGFMLTDRAAELAGLAPGARVLDTGCGTGATVRRLRSRFGVFAVGADADMGQLAAAREKSLPVLCADGERLAVASGSMDMVFCECVLSLLPHSRKALMEFLRVLRSGGYLALSDLYALSGASCGSGQSCGCAQGAFGAGLLEDMVREAGFEIVVREDHSRLLKELAARIVLAGGSPCGTPSGYVFILARKKDDRHA